MIFPKPSLRVFSLALACVASAAALPAQDYRTHGPDGEVDPCGYPDTTSAAYKALAASNWGYGYDSLKADLALWGASPYVRIDSAGASVRGRALYVVSIEDTATPAAPRLRVWIHARTHPSEVQGTWVTNEIVRILLSASPLAETLRGHCVFNIMPMYNPDGVELQRPRENANGVDLESNWSFPPGEPEVQVLRGTFERLMAEPNPILIALNMHSSYECTRYFVYHAESGTSPSYAALEQQFIGSVTATYPGRFEPWDYFVSWTSVAPTRYPESWFWYNHGETVLALTYEDGNCPQAGGFDSTAYALLSGIRSQLLGPAGVEAHRSMPPGFALLQSYPNPMNPGTTFVIHLPEEAHVRIVLYDILGREVRLLLDEPREAGRHEVRFDGEGLATGTYICRLWAGDRTAARKLLLLR